MKKLLSFIFIIPMLFACSQKGNFTVTGVIDGAEGSMIYLNELKLNSQVEIDSVKIDSQGRFELSGNSSQPTFYLLKLTDNNFVTILADSADVIRISGEEKNFTHNYHVEGSEGSTKIKELSNKFGEAKKEERKLFKKYQDALKSKSTDSMLNELADSYNKVITNYSEFATGFVKENPFSMVSVYTLYQQWESGSYVVQDFQAMKVAASALSAVYPESDHVKALHANTLSMMRAQQNQALRQLMEEQGDNSPDIVLPDVNGNEVKLSSLRGKHVLIQFWSSQDRGSRILNPVLVENYKQFKNKGFEIYQVSIDTDKEQWQKAIKEDNLSWIQVGDMLGSNVALNSYNVREIPFNYLLNPEGEIVGKNITGPKLNSVLKGILN